MTRRPILAFLALLVLTAVGPAGAHDFWIEPSRFRAESPVMVDIGLRVGQLFKGDSVPYIDSWFSRFEVRDSGGVRPVRSQIGDDPAGRIEQRLPGATWIVYQSSDGFVELPPEKFRHYLESEGMEYILALRESRGMADKPAREQYQRSVKSLLWWPAEDAPFTGADSGLPLELVPLANPYALAPGDLLELEVRFFGQPIPGLLVRAHTRDRPDAVVRARSDAAGRVGLRLASNGDWMVKAVHMVALENHAEADWQSYWASLTFAMARR